MRPVKTCDKCKSRLPYDAKSCPFCAAYQKSEWHIALAGLLAAAMIVAAYYL